MFRKASELILSKNWRNIFFNNVYVIYFLSESCVTPLGLCQPFSPNNFLIILFNELLNPQQTRICHFVSLCAACLSWRILMSASKVTKQLYWEEEMSIKFPFKVGWKWVKLKLWKFSVVCAEHIDALIEEIVWVSIWNCTWLF